jgi:hypothetical protein
MYEDGGSIGGVLSGSEGDTLAFSWDGRIRVVGRDDLDAPRLAYLGASHPTNGSALAVGSPAESSLVDALHLAVDATVPRGEQDGLASTYFDYSRTWEERYASLPHMTPALRSAMYAYRVVGLLTEQRARRAGAPRDE